MKQFGLWKRGLSRAIILVVLGASPLLSGCGALPAFDAAFLYKPEQPTRNTVLIFGGRSEVNPDELAGKFALMALFSKVVYRHDLPLTRRYTEGSCSYVAPHSTLPEFGMPWHPDGSKWMRWRGTENVLACLDEGGLAYETYVHQRADGVVDRAVIAFRGTENHPKQILYDWGSNLAAVLGAEPPQYRRSQETVRELVNALHRTWNGIEIYVTGHSLGGGLAQQAAYLSRHIKAAYVFNPSPVTNWANLAIKHRFALQEHRDPVIEQPNPEVHRIYHWNEALADVRDVAGRFVSKSLKRRDYEFFFAEASKVKAHDMGLLACNLSRLFKEPEAAYGLTKMYARYVTSKAYGEAFETHPICPGVLTH